MDRKTLETIQRFQSRCVAVNTLISLPAGTYEGQVPGFPGLIDRNTALKETMEFLIPRWDDFSTDPGFPDTVRVWMWPLDDPQPSEPFTTFTVSSPGTGGVPVNIALARRPPGAHLIRYEVFVDNIGNSTQSEPQLLIVDLAPPYYSHVGPIPAPLPPADLPTPATLDYFQGLPNQAAMFRVPDYMANGRAPGDYLLAYYNNSDTPYLPTAGSTDPKWVLPENLNFPLPLSVVEGSPDGLRSVRYELYDAAGNPARLSSQFVFDVGLFPAPSNFRAPTIDLAVPGDLLIDRSDAAQLNGAIIRIPAYADFLRGDEGDMISVTLTTSLGTVTLPDVPLGSNTFPVQVHVGFPTLALLYGATEGLLSMTVSYAVKRRSVSYPSAQTATTDLDLFVVGPANPNEPDLVNPNLNPVVVRGEDATGAEGPPNELLPEHANRPANAYITLWDEPPTPDAGPFTIYLFYEGVQVDSLFVPSGIADQVVRLQIPWSAVSDHNNGTKRVHYTIGAAGSSNRQVSPTTLVEVTANIIFLAPPLVRNLIGSGAGIINCTSFRPVGPPPGNIIVFVPPSEHFLLGMIVTVHWRGYRDDAGTIEVPAVAGSKASAPLTQSMINLGFEIELEDYFTRFKPIQPTTDDRLAGSARVHYSIVLPSGPVNSSDATPRVRGQQIGGTGPVFCDGMAVPAP
ncbi:Uncharacterised protein [Pseudomonas fluorescens]|uniref:Uncharacterized protein n=1 Tax=Pseudomonas fluorescens TaxID=294 RepID=A0A379IE62_PSEFL|nr:hypothetical protein [Pseudomonas fluorescens]AIG01374.1 hypothetical protein HZ99_04005 [Pseudomonas fluorescens]SUD31137.1 Uncharacterised protein [Pseudomonas fluorescens]